MLIPGSSSALISSFDLQFTVRPAAAVAATLCEPALQFVSVLNHDAIGRLIYAVEIPRDVTGA